MANEISVSVKLSVSKGDLSVTESSGNIRFDMIGSHAYSQVFDVGVTDTHLVIPTNISLAGVCYFQNLDEEDDIEISTMSGSNFFLASCSTIPPGGFWLNWLTPGQNYYARILSEYGENQQLKMTVIEL